MSPQLAAKLKEFDDWCDRNGKTAEKAEQGKAEMRQQLAKIPVEALQIWALDVGIKMAKKASNK